MAPTIQRSVSGPHFRDYRLLLDDHGDQIFALTDDIAERVRKIGGTTVRSIGHIAGYSASPICVAPADFYCQPPPSAL